MPEPIRSLAEVQRDLLKTALVTFCGDKEKVAKTLGVTVRWVQLKIHEYDLDDFHLPRGRPRKQTDFLDRLIIRR